MSGCACHRHFVEGCPHCHQRFGLPWTDPSRVLFKLDPDREIEHTEIGPGFDRRAPAAPRDPLARFPIAAACLAGIPYVRDVAGPADSAHLVQIEDDELVECIDRDRALRAAVERELDLDTEVVDVEDL